MLKNLANYKVGKTYKFSIKNKGEKTVAVLAKGDKQLKLEVDGIVEWFSSDKLTSVKKDYHKKPTKVAVVAEISDAILPEKYQGNLGIAPPKTVQKVTKVVAHQSKVEAGKEEILLTTTIDAEKLLEGTKVEDYDYVALCIKRDLRIILKKHGYDVDIKTKLRLLLGMINHYLPVASKKDLCKK